jgi:hypothetical protein
VSEPNEFRVKGVVENSTTSRSQHARNSQPNLERCPCRWGGLFFEHLFEYLFDDRDSSIPKEAHMASEIIPAGEVLIDGPTTPIEFTFKGRRFRIHAVLSRWCESGGWWNRVSDGKYRPDDQARALWRVEAAPIGALTTFELERDETTGQWIVTTI